KRRLKAIGRQDIEKLHSSMKATPYQANRVLELLSVIFNYAIKENIGTDNPARGIEAFPEAKRECWLTVEDLQRFREALDYYADQNAANALRLLMLTGSREGEVLKAEWEEFDLARGVWTKPSHHTKQKKLEHIPLSVPALKLLESMMPVNPTGPLFPGATGGARTTLRRPWVQACKKAGLVETSTVKGKRHTITKFRPTIRIHDLRHNFASHLASNGVTLQIVGKLLGHTMAQTTMRYAHLQDEALRAATNRFGEIYSEAKKA
ncbi:MAG: site-specific integrase, partial [Nitrososphaerales archaeon]